MRHGDRKDPAATILKRFGLKYGGLDGTPLDGVPKACVSAGKAALDYPGAPTCCETLRRIDLARTRGAAGCIAATGAGDPDKTGYCTRCGDGQWVAPENRCNCEADCGT